MKIIKISLEGGILSGRAWCALHLYFYVLTELSPISIPSNSK